MARLACPCGTVTSVDLQLVDRVICASCGNAIRPKPRAGVRTQTFDVATYSSSPRWTTVAVGVIGILLTVGLVVALLVRFSNPTSTAHHEPAVAARETAPPPGRLPEPLTKAPATERMEDTARTREAVDGRLRRSSARPVTGTVIDRGDGRNGLGSLEVDNGNDVDAVVRVVDEDQSDRVVRSLYVRAHEKATLSGVPPGTYRLLYSTGTEWNFDSGRFDRGARFGTFAEPFAFAQRTRGDTTTYRTFEVTLHTVSGGTAHTRPIDEDTFRGTAKGTER